MNYATQMEAARRGILTEEMNAVAAKAKNPRSTACKPYGGRKGNHSLQ